MLQKAPHKIRAGSPFDVTGSPCFLAGMARAYRRVVLGISESLVTFVDGANGALSFIEFRLPSQCRILESLVGTLAAVGVQILHIQVRAQRDHVNHRVRVAECDGSAVNAPRRTEVQQALLGLVEIALRNVRRPLAKSNPSGRVATPAGPVARVP